MSDRTFWILLWVGIAATVAALVVAFVVLSNRAAEQRADCESRGGVYLAPKHGRYCIAKGAVLMVY